MKEIMVKVTCPSCKSEWYIKTAQVIHANMEENARNAILDDYYFSRKCSNCDTVFKIMYPLYYVDSKSKLMLALNEGEEIHFDVHDATLFEKRIAKTHADFIETIRIFEAGFSDKIMYIVKHQLYAFFMKRGDEVKEIRFYEYDPKEDLLWFHITDDKIDPKAIAFHFYDKVLKEMKMDKVDGFMSVDEDWYQTLLTNNLPL